MHLQTPIKRFGSSSMRVDLNDQVRFNTSWSTTGAPPRARSPATLPVRPSRHHPDVADSWFNPFGSHHGYDTPTDVHGTVPGRFLASAPAI
jgi:iron complex outermembrane receptor protein